MHEKFERNRTHDLSNDISSSTRVPSHTHTRDAVEWWEICRIEQQQKKEKKWEYRGKNMKYKHLNLQYIQTVEIIRNQPRANRSKVQTHTHMNHLEKEKNTHTRLELNNKNNKNEY